MSVIDWFKRRPQPPKDGKTILAERTRQGPEGERALLIQDHPAFEKMSEVLEEFAWPWVKQSKRDQLPEVICIACLAWNLALLPTDKREQMLAKFGLEKMSRDQRIMIRKMISRKLELFPHNHRIILDYHLEIKGDDMSLNVVSSLEPDQAAQLTDAELEALASRLPPKKV